MDETLRDNLHKAKIMEERDLVRKKMWATRRRVRLD